MDLVVKETNVYVVWTKKDENGDTLGVLEMGIFEGTQENILQYLNDNLDWDYTLTLDDLIFDEQTMYTLTEG